MSTDESHLKLQEAFEQCPGQWVAIDRRTGHVVTARPNPYDLAAFLKEKKIAGVEIVRAPAEDEPELVGWG